ncbi:MAG: ACT domain-containing protein [Anaerolineae bacterium]|nr:ACT domain-containing protein [Anaerolineae bacterium]
MNGETNLVTLLATMQPVLAARPYIFTTLTPDAYHALPFAPLGTFWEAEGVTVIASQEQAIASGLLFENTWACITLTVHSALTAVGFLAAITARLAQAGIPVNPVSAYYHDHLFVPWERRQEAMVILQ